MNNTIVYAGEIGSKLCLLNRTKEELVELWNHRNENKITIDDVMEIEFYDEFEVYDIWVNN